MMNIPSALAAALLLLSAGCAATDPSASAWKLTAFQDADTVMPAAIFSGADADVIARLAPEGSAPASVNAFLLENPCARLLVDTGNGAPAGRLLEALAEAGVTPESIDVILLTHMHFDHIGGLSTAAGEAVFPRAAILVSRPEYDYWKSNERVKKIMAPYAGRIVTFGFDEEVIPGIIARDAAGHTPGHTVYEAGPYMILGDLAHAALLQFPEPDICASYDMDRPQAVAARKKFFGLAADSGKTVAGMHLPYPGTGSIARDGRGGFVFNPTVDN